MDTQKYEYWILKDGVFQCTLKKSPRGTYSLSIDDPQYLNSKTLNRDHINSLQRIFIVAQEIIEKE